LHCSFRLAYANFLNKLEVEFNVSQTAVADIGNEISLIAQKVHHFTVHKLEKRLGQCYFILKGAVAR
jgi:CII-binding regulator of phage lambda lysogenization HflD